MNERISKEVCVYRPYYFLALIGLMLVLCVFGVKNAHSTLIKIGVCGITGIIVFGLIGGLGEGVWINEGFVRIRTTKLPFKRASAKILIESVKEIRVTIGGFNDGCELVLLDETIVSLPDLPAGKVDKLRNIFQRLTGKEINVVKKRLIDGAEGKGSGKGVKGKGSGNNS